MLIYNDQKDVVFKNEETFGMLIPEDNFWRRVNKVLDYDKLGNILSDVVGDRYSDVVRLFKCILMKAYYRITDAVLVEKMESDLVFEYFLEYNYLETESLDSSVLKDFRREKVDEKFIASLAGIVLNNSFKMETVDPSEWILGEIRSTVDILKDDISSIDASFLENNPRTLGVAERDTTSLLKVLKDNSRFLQDDKIKKNLEYLEELMAEDIDENIATMQVIASSFLDSLRRVI